MGRSMKPFQLWPFASDHSAHSIHGVSWNQFSPGPNSDSVDKTIRRTGHDIWHGINSWFRLFYWTGSELRHLSTGS